MKLGQKTLEYLLLLVIVAIAYCAYQFGYVHFNERAEAVEKQNQQYQARVAELNAKIESLSVFEEGVTAANQIVKDVLGKYGPGNTPEKSIMMITKLERDTEFEVSSIAFNSDTPVFVSEDVDESGNPILQMDKTNVTLSYSCTYDGLKACMDFINDYRERMNVESFSASLNEDSDRLSGSMIIDLYSVKDENHIYTEPTVEGVEIGTDNIFGSGAGSGNPVIRDLKRIKGMLEDGAALADIFGEGSAFSELLNTYTELMKSITDSASIDAILNNPELLEKLTAKPETQANSGNGSNGSGTTGGNTDDTYMDIDSSLEEMQNELEGMLDDMFDGLVTE